MLYLQLIPLSDELACNLEATALALPGGVVARLRALWLSRRIIKQEVRLTSEAKRERGRRHDVKRRQSKPWRALYKTAQWQALRAAQLSKQPLCERCLAKTPQVITAANVVHHKVKHEGIEEIFFDADNLASSCQPCHDRDEQQIEKRGYSTECGDDGFPVDPNHPFNQP